MADNEDRKDLDDDQPEIEGGATPAQQNEDEVERQRKLEDEKRQRAEAVKKRREDQQKKTNVLKSKDEPIKPTATPAAAPKKPIREDVVNSCVNFLNHPKVKGSPQSQKVLFLQKKGLTQDEIDEAIRRANSAATPTTTTPSPAPQAPTYPTTVAPAPGQYQAPPGYPAPYPYYPPQQQQLVPASQSWTSTRFGLLVTAAACMSVGAGIAYLARKYIFSDKEAELKLRAEQAAKEEERRKKEEEDRKANAKVLEEMVATLKSIQTQNNEMSELVKTYQTQVTEWRESAKKTTIPTSTQAAPAMDNYSKMMMSEMQSQLNALKAQVIDMKSNQQTKPAWSPATSKPAIPSWQQTDSNPPTTTTTTTTTAKVEEKPEVAPYPKDFQSIMQMVQNGQTPPGIREINDKPLDPHAKVERGVRETPVKPWTRSVEEVPTTTTTTTTTTSEEVSVDQQQQ